MQNWLRQTYVCKEDQHFRDCCYIIKRITPITPGMDIHFEIHNSFNISGQKEITDIILRI